MFDRKKERCEGWTYKDEETNKVWKDLKERISNSTKKEKRITP